VCSTYATTRRSAFLLSTYVPDSTPENIINLISTQLDTMKTQGVPTSSEDVALAAIVEPLAGPLYHTAIHDAPITTTTTTTSPHLRQVPYAHAITLPTFSPAIYGLIVLASR